MHRRTLPAALAAAAALALPSAASAAPPLPFGHACTPQNGTLFCPTPGPSSRVSSWDGTPLDADVTLPASGDGPFPTIVLLHGWGQSKTSFESSSRDGNGGATFHYNNVYFAQLGFAVVTYSARGFGHSCGRSDPATAGCERGWSHLADQRYEVRDTQHLLGVLADEGIAKPDALGVSGISYGGGQSMQLALLRDHVRLPDGTLAPWRSPAGTPLSIAAAWPRWGWSDLGRALVPNGLPPTAGTIGQPLTPVGVPIQSYINLLYTIRGTSAPPGADATADLANWKAITDRGERGAAAVAVLRELQTFHSAAGLLGAPGLGQPAPTLLENGWTDDLFPPREALAFYDAVRRRYPQATVGLQLADLGHSRGSNKPDVDRALNDQGDTFLGYYLPSGGPVPAYALIVGVTAYRQTCPRLAPAGGGIRATTYAGLARGAVRLRGGPGIVTSRGGSDVVGRADDPATGGEVGADACTTVRAARAPGTAAYQLRTRGFTLVGLPTVRARVRAHGVAPQLIARVWDVLPDGSQRLVTRGAYRLRNDQSGTIAFQLHGNAYRFAPGHRVLLELGARDAPYYRPPDTSFTIRLRSASLTLPSREGPRRSRGIGKPAVPR